VDFMDIEKQLYSILEESFGIKNVEITDTLKDWEIDSLDMVELKMICEERFDIEFADEDLDISNPTIEDVVELIEEKLNGDKEETS
tara:strand:+ start:125 stop:382 length:258 start_codon:yes stop_codon:yes gene_type:complete